jgi:hypothetical protein
MLISTRTMNRTATIAVLLALTGCSGVPLQTQGSTACAAGEASYACQVERYHNIAAQ